MVLSPLRLNIILFALLWRHWQLSHAYVFRRSIFFVKKYERWNEARVLRYWNNLSDKEQYDLKFVEEIKNSRSKIQITCQNNHVFAVNVDSFLLRGSRCKICISGEPWNKLRFLREIELLKDKNDYIFSNYESIHNIKSKFSVTCKTCGNTWSARISSFFYNKTRCSFCNVGPPWNKSKFLQEIDLLKDKDDYIFKDYENICCNKSKFSVICKKCGYNWEVSCRSFFTNGSRCKNCMSGEQWSNFRVEREFNLTKDCKNFSLILTDKITKSVSSFDVKCKYQHIWTTTPVNYFSKGRRCPICNESIGERNIALFLTNHFITYNRQQKFDTCKNISSLRFDFYLTDYKLLIEHQGQQHFFPVKFSSKHSDEYAEIRLKDTQHRDSIKRNWALSNGYTFLEIRYDEMDQIETKLMDLLNIYYI